MQITNEDYQALADSLAQKSKTSVNCVKAFGIGGLICVLGQGLTAAYRAAGLSESPSTQGPARWFPLPVLPIPLPLPRWSSKPRDMSPALP